MFLLKTLYFIVTLRPMDFTKDINDKIRNKINAAVEGKCILPHGFVICVDEILKILPLQVNEEGHALFKVKYNALVFKPYRDEVIDVIISSITNEGIDAKAGFFSVFLSAEELKLRLEELCGTGNLSQIGADDSAMNNEEEEEDDDAHLKDGQYRVDDDCLKFRIAGKDFEFSKDMILRIQIFSTAINNQQIVNIHTYAYIHIIFIYSIYSFNILFFLLFL